MSDNDDVAVDFRREYGALLASLSRRVGVAHLAAIEDAAATALMRAVERWPLDRPRQPSAWLYRVAFNHLMSALRQQRRRATIVEGAVDGAIGIGAFDVDGVSDGGDVVFAGEVGDDVLRLLFVCCDDELPVPSQLALALKLVGGFGVAEIAAHVFQSEASVAKRLTRARLHLQQAWQGPERERAWDPARFDVDVVESRRPAVLHVIYMMFTEGHLSSSSAAVHDDDGGGPVRHALCAEALRLGSLLCRWDDARGVVSPEARALLALMLLHAARFDGRVDGGVLIPLEAQDRGRVDRALLAEGLGVLSSAAVGDRFSRYHAEAAVVAEHAMAPSFRETRWDRIAEAYALWENISPSPLHTLNRAVAVAEHLGPKAGLAILADVVPPPWLDASWMWSAVLADLHGRAGHIDEAHVHAERALATAPTSALKAALQTTLTRRLRRGD